MFYFEVEQIPENAIELSFTDENIDRFFDYVKQNNVPLLIQKDLYDEVYLTGFKTDFDYLTGHDDIEYEDTHDDYKLLSDEQKSDVRREWDKYHEKIDAIISDSPIRKYAVAANINGTLVMFSGEEDLIDPEDEYSEFMLFDDAEELLDHILEVLDINLTSKQKEDLQAKAKAESDTRLTATKTKWQEYLLSSDEFWYCTNKRRRERFYTEHVYKALTVDEVKGWNWGRLCDAGEDVWQRIKNQK